MDLDELRDAWRARASRDATAAYLADRAELHRRREQLDDTLRPMATEWFTISVGGMLALAAGSFWIHHRAVPHLLAIGLLMQLYAFAVIGYGIRLYSLVDGIDITAPVLAVQRQVGLLGRVTVLGAIVIGLPWWVLWITGLAMGITAATGIDPMVRAPALFAWGIGTGLIGMVVSAAAIWRAYRHPRTSRQLTDFLGGPRLARAQRQLDDLADFAEDLSLEMSDDRR
jgi:hypothetical protein